MLLDIIIIKYMYIMLLILVLVGVLLYIICTKYGIIVNQRGGSSLGEMETVPPFVPVHLPPSVTGAISSLPSLPSLPSLYSSGTTQNTVEADLSEHTAEAATRHLSEHTAEAETRHLSEHTAEEQPNYGWFCNSDFFAPVTIIGNEFACMSEDGKNCSWGYCEGEKIIKALPKVQIPILCDASSPDSWCVKVAQVVKDKRKAVEKLDETVDNVHEALSEINRTLDRKGNLSGEEQQRVLKAAADLQYAEQQIHSEETILKASQKQVQRGVSEVSKDETMAKNILVQSEHQTPSKKDPLTLKNHITLIKGVLDNHNKRLRRLESYLCQVKSEMNSGKHLLQDMTNKLSDSIKPNKYMPAQEEDIARTEHTIKRVKKSLKCPVCPMYEHGLVSPTGALDMWH